MTFKIDGIDVDVVVLRKKIKNLYVRVKDNKIVVSTNTYTSDKYINNLLEKNRKSIEKMYKTQIKKEPTKIYYLGEELKYEFDNKIKIDEYICYGPSIESIDEYLEKNSINIFNERLERLKIMFNDLPEFRLRVRKMKTRWGVCNKKSMTITLNTDLIHKDVTLIDYVIIHELCHFKHMNHSEKFWEEVEKYYPYYKLARKRLKDND